MIRLVRITSKVKNAASFIFGEDFGVLDRQQLDEWSVVETHLAAKLKSRSQSTQKWAAERPAEGKRVERRDAQ